MHIKTGIITSNRMQKTLVVKVQTYKSHPKYKKRYLVSKKFYTHSDDPSKYNIGDEITIVETRPVSKLKRWKVLNQ
jgi:small subunit ribosomal protein S17